MAKQKEKKTRIHFVSDAASLKRCSRYNRLNTTQFSKTSSPLHRVITLYKGSKYCYDLALVVQIIERKLHKTEIPSFEYVSRRTKIKRTVPITVSELYSIAKAVWYYNFRQQLLQKNDSIKIPKIVSFLLETAVSSKKKKQLQSIWKRPTEFEVLFSELLQKNNFQYDSLNLKWKHVDDNDDTDSSSIYFKVPKRWKKKFKTLILNEHVKERQQKEHERDKELYERHVKRLKKKQQKQEHEYKKQLYKNWKENEISDLKRENMFIVAQCLDYEKDQQRELQLKPTPYSIEKRRI